MKRRHLNQQLVKRNRNYSVNDVSNLLGVHKSTVRNWVKTKGLMIIDDRRPMLIVGCDLYSFIKRQKRKNKRKCEAGELFCVKCRIPQMAIGQEIICHPMTPTIGRIEATCLQCSSTMNRFVNISKATKVFTNLKVVTAKRE